MNSLEARFILEACRAGDLDAAEPRAAAALRALETDPELQDWFAASQEFDHAVAAKLKAVPVPGDLAARIRAGRTRVEAPRRWQRREWLGLAALLALLAALAALLAPAPAPRHTPASVATFRDGMSDFLNRQWDGKFDLADPEFEKLKAWLESRTDSIQIDVPLALASSRTIGCKTLQWHGGTATLICFMPGNTGTVVHILVVDRGALSDAPGGEPQFARVANWNSAVWSRDGKTYLALTTAEAGKLSACL